MAAKEPKEPTPKPMGRPPKGRIKLTAKLNLRVTPEQAAKAERIGADAIRAWLERSQPRRAARAGSIQEPISTVPDPAGNPDPGPDNQAPIPAPTPNWWEVNPKANR